MASMKSRNDQAKPGGGDLIIDFRQTLLSHIPPADMKMHGFVDSVCLCMQCVPAAATSHWRAHHPAAL